MNCDKNLCFWLGFFFSFFGILLGAIVGKEDGVKAALKGFCWSIAIFWMVWMLMTVFSMCLSIDGCSTSSSRCDYDAVASSFSETNKCVWTLAPFPKMQSYPKVDEKAQDEAENTLKESTKKTDVDKCTKALTNKQRESDLDKRLAESEKSRMEAEQLKLEAEKIRMKAENIRLKHKSK